MVDACMRCNVLSLHDVLVMGVRACMHASIWISKSVEWYPLLTMATTHQSRYQLQYYYIENHAIYDTLFFTYTLISMCTSQSPRLATHLLPSLSKHPITITTVNTLLFSFQIFIIFQSSLNWLWREFIRVCSRATVIESIKNQF